MATLKRACASCRREIDVQVGQRVTPRGLVWHASYTCPHCGATIEEDDVGFPPEDVRQAILAADGTYELRLASQDDATHALKVVREALKLSLEETLAYRKRIPGAFASGTRAEMEWLASLMRREKIDVTVETPVPPDTTG